MTEPTAILRAEAMLDDIEASLGLNGLKVIKHLVDERIKNALNTLANERKEPITDLP